MKKRIINTLMAGMMAICLLAGCGGSSGSSSAAGAAPAADSSAAAPAADSSAEEAAPAAEAEGSQAESTKTDAPKGGYRMTLIMSLRDEFLSTLEAASSSAAKANGVTLTVQDAQNDMSKQIQFVESARNNGDAACIVIVVDSDAAAEIVNAAGDMKVVFLNRLPSDISLLNENVVCVSSDENQAGDMQAEFLANYFKKQGKTEIKYILLSGTLGQISTTLRTESCLKGLEARGIKATEASAPLAADYDRATAIDMISPLIGTVDFDCIISNNDAMALGAIEAMESKGMDPASIPIVGVDATADGRQAISEGKLAMSVFQNPVGQGEGAAKAAINMINGNPVNQDTGFEFSNQNNFWVDVPFELVTKDNVANYN
ncbi:MAG: substrate-binding domain-containing protein [Lachnospiraceae bacterium]|nr:substrate-binding domain-containing protein [Lachnospiraceae bacterium]